MTRGPEESRPQTEPDVQRPPELIGIPFAVAQAVYCQWEWDHFDRNLDFLKGLDTSYYWNVAVFCTDHADEDSDTRLSASIVLRGAYHQGIETLFSLLGAHTQAPNAVAAWVSKARTEQLREVAKALRDGEPLLTQSGIQGTNLNNLSAYVHRFAWQGEPPSPDSTPAMFARFWIRLADDFLDENLQAEYNAIKHGLRISPGGFSVSIGLEETPGVAAPADDLRSLGSSVFGSTFFRPEGVGESKHHIRARRVSLNWSAEAMAKRLCLISLSINNVVGSLQCLAGEPAEGVKFNRPVPASAFVECWTGGPTVKSTTMDTSVRISRDSEATRDELRSVLKNGGAAQVGEQQAT